MPEPRPQSITLAVRVTPRAKRNAVLKTGDKSLKVYVTAPPEDGCADHGHNAVPRRSVNRLPPVAVDPNDASPAMIPAAFDPNRAPVWRENPMAPDPLPMVMVPNPCACDPHVLWPRRRHGDFDDHCRRRGSLDSFLNRSGRRWRRRRNGIRWRSRSHGRRCRRWRRTAARSVNHKVDDLLAGSAVLQIQNVGGAQVIYRVRTSNLAQDDFITDTAFR